MFFHLYEIIENTTNLEGQKADNRLPGTYKMRDGLQSGMNNLLVVRKMVYIYGNFLWIYITVKPQKSNCTILVDAVHCV